jgi:hypothetical protein
MLPLKPVSWILGSLCTAVRLNILNKEIGGWGAQRAAAWPRRITAAWMCPRTKSRSTLGEALDGEPRGGGSWRGRVCCLLRRRCCRRRAAEPSSVKCSKCPLFCEQCRAAFGTAYAGAPRGHCFLHFVLLPFIEHGGAPRISEKCFSRLARGTSSRTRG